MIKARAGKGAQKTVLTIQDTGGQPIFLSILELLTTPQATVYMVVFSLKDLRDGFERCTEEVRVYCTTYYIAYYSV